MLKYFNSQPREGGWRTHHIERDYAVISTHSRAKAAGLQTTKRHRRTKYFNSQPREGGWGFQVATNYGLSIFQLTAARRRLVSGTNSAWLSCDFNSQPREGGWRFRYAAQKPWPIFQLTAARRRLAGWRFGGCVQNKISTHSRAKAAGFRRPPAWRSRNDFNSQPREGGWALLFCCQSR